MSGVVSSEREEAGRTTGATAMAERDLSLDTSNKKAKAKKRK